MAAKKKVSQRGTQKRKTRKKASAVKPSRQADSLRTRKHAATRLGEMARDVAEFAEVLGTGAAAPGLEPDASLSEGSDKVPAATLRRLELLAVLLDNQTRELNSDSPTANVPVIPRNSLAFSWVPDVNVNNNSVSVGIPGVGEVSIGSDGASASVDGVGGASVNAGGVSVNAGGAGVTVDGNGATVTMPGAGTVSVGPDGSVSVGAPTGGNDGSGLPFPSLPIPSFCTNELKIPIPVPKFVVEPIEIPVSVPQLNSTPLSIAIPAPELAPMPIKIPYPEFDFNLGSPHLGDLGSFDPIMDVALAEMIQNLLKSMNDMNKDAIEQLILQDDAAGNPDKQRIIKVRTIIESIAPLFPVISDAYENLRTHIIGAPVAVTSALLAGWEQVKVLVIKVLKKLDKLLKGVVGFVSPVGALIAAIRLIYMIVIWILARLVRGTIKVTDALSSLLMQVGSRLQALT